MSPVDIERMFKIIRHPERNEGPLYCGGKPMPGFFAELTLSEAERAQNDAFIATGEALLKSGTASSLWKRVSAHKGPRILVDPIGDCRIVVVLVDYLHIMHSKSTCPQQVACNSYLRA